MVRTRMAHWGWGGRLGALGMAAVLVTSACGTGAQRSASTKDDCALSAKLVPSCGVLWGVATRPHQARDVTALEQQVGRKFDFVYRYHDINDAIPDAAERQVAAGGRILHISVVSRDFSHPNGTTVTWRDVAAGRYDDALKAQAKGIASLHAPVFMTFEHEANQPAKEALGSPADFKAAWRHVHDVYTEAGATNAVWVWVMMGSDLRLTQAGRLWPGNDDVDWISWDVYNQSGCRGDGVDSSKFISFADKMLLFYRWVHDQGPKVGMDPNKPMMISEAGSAQYTDQPAKTADWYAQIPSVLQRYPQIRALGLWASSNQGCDYRFQNDPTILKAVAGAGKAPWIDTKTPGAGTR